MLTIAVCDDDQGILGELTAEIERTFAQRNERVEIHAFTHSSDLLPLVEKTPADVYFLDIDMPEVNGLALGEALREQHSGFCLLYISNREERVYETFKLQPLRFIRKSHFYDEIGEAADAVLQWKEQQKVRFLILEQRDQILSLPIEDILYIECIGKTQKIVMNHRTITVRSTLGFFERKLSDRGFLKPHRAFLVNVQQIDCIESSSILLHSGAIVPISKYKVTETKEAYLKFIFNALSTAQNPVRAEQRKTNNDV